MELDKIFTGVNPNVAIFLLTSLFAFVSWIIKGLFEKPLAESKTTFNQFFEKRVEMLTEVKARLHFIAYFPHDEGKEYKEQLQKLLLKDGKAAYLNKNTYESVLRISIDPDTKEELLLKTIEEIDKDLYSQISKVQGEIKFYRRFSNFNPFQKFLSFITLLIQYISSLFLGLVLLYLVIYGLFFTSCWITKGVTILLIIIVPLLINKWLNK